MKKLKFYHLIIILLTAVLGNVLLYQKAQAEVDTVPPEITSVTVPANGNYKAEDSLVFIVNISEEVVVIGTDSKLELQVGETTQYAIFVSAATSSMTYSYTIEAGLNDSDGISVGNNIILNSTTVKDLAGNDLILALNSVGSTAGVKIDTTPPGTPIGEASMIANYSKPTWSWSSGGGGNGIYRFKLDNEDLTTGSTEGTTTSYTPTSAL
jgi:hypothetical protein